MFTIEFDFDEVCVTVVDDWSNHEDLIVNSFDDIVFIRQWCVEADRFVVIAISPAQWEDLIASMNSKEGAFQFTRQ
jgi:hypothetical protein